MQFNGEQEREEERKVLYLAASSFQLKKYGEDKKGNFAGCFALCSGTMQYYAAHFSG